MLKDEFLLHGVTSSTGGSAVLLIINGPIRHEIGANCTFNALANSDRATAAIGRALRVSLINLLDVRPGGIDRTTLGVGSRASRRQMFPEFRAARCSIRSWSAAVPGRPLRSPQRHDISRKLIRIWVKSLKLGPAGAFDEDARAADLLQEYEAKIAALERMVGRQALELHFRRELAQLLTG